MATDDHAEALAQIVDQLLDQAADLRRGWDALAAALDDLEVEGGPAAPADAEAAAPPAGDGDDPRRLIALNMALNGQSREETAAYLRQQFGEDGTDAILADVYDA